MESTAVYIDTDGKLVGKTLTAPPPADGEILIEVLYSGVNPTDIRASQFFGYRDRVLGNEFCGRVLESPSLELTPFAAGDIVAGLVEQGGKRPNHYGTHQSYITIPPARLWKVPGNIPLPEAATLTLILQTASDAIFNRLKLPLPGPTKGKGAVEGTLVIWGGSSAVGRAAIQLGRASDVKSIIVTASKERHEYLQTLGATQCVDYRDDDAVEKVKALLQHAGQAPILGFDSIGTPDSQTLLANATADHRHHRRLTTVLLVGNEGFEVTVGIRHVKVSFPLPGGDMLVFPAVPTEADRMWKAQEWVIEHYGDGFKAHPVQVHNGTIEEAIHKIRDVGGMKLFGKIALKHPLIN